MRACAGDFLANEQDARAGRAPHAPCSSPVSDPGRDVRKLRVYSAAMPRIIRDTLISARELVSTAGPFILLTIALLVAAYYWLKPTPPKRVVLATGSEQGAYS